MGIKFCSLSSGSSGNCQYIETDSSKIIVDSGFSGKRTKELLNSIDVDPKDLDAILVTHEHLDHIKGVGVLSRRYDLPIYANGQTWSGMETKIGDIKEKNIKIFSTEKFFDLKDLSIYPITTFHDANEPVGYILFYKGVKISIITDTGFISKNIVEKVKDSDLYFLESNHDEFMLKEGLYPWHLKRRILSSKGHLSNEDAGNTLTRILKGEGEKVILAHLSKDNNVPELAMDTVTDILTKGGLDVKKDIDLGLSFRDKTTCVYKF
ncbi:MAG: MBL fold metallo-hydrolase [Tissierella sp.]|uniref:MBL fold metallo-hydrolase n=1 Tax=Tissierella sp. TaxID=41274 RepID=UPI003F95E7F8